MTYKNEELEIKAMQNGYKISYDYREANPTPESPKNWDYVSEEYMFSTWPEVVTFVTNKPLEIPPLKI